MIPFGIGCATISLISHDKVGAFVRDIGHAEWGVDISPHARNHSAAGIADEVWRVLEAIDIDRPAMHAAIVAAQQALLAHTERNMLRFADNIQPRARAFVHSNTTPVELLRRPHG